MMDFLISILKALNVVPVPLLDGQASVIKGRAIMEANRAGVFHKIAAAPGGLTSDEIAQQVGFNPEGTVVLLNALVSAKYLKERNGHYFNSRWVKRWILDPVHGLHNLIYLQIYTYRRLDELGDNLRNGRPTMDVHQKASEPSWYQEIYTRAMREAARMIIPSLIKQITLPPSAKRMLDIGGAHGEYSRAMARKFPGLKPTVFDLGGPISTAQDIINQEGNAAGLELKVGNCLLDDFGPGWDAILMVNMVHLFDREQNLNLFRKAKASLNPGGKILTVDQYVGVSKFRDRVFALVSLNFYNVGGKSYPVSEMHELLTEAGFTNIKLRPLGYTVPAALIEATA